MVVVKHRVFTIPRVEPLPNRFYTQGKWASCKASSVRAQCFGVEWRLLDEAEWARYTNDALKNSHVILRLR